MGDSFTPQINLSKVKIVIISLILGMIGIIGSVKLHNRFISHRQGPPPAVALLEPDPPPTWRKFSLGETLLTPHRNDYTAVLVAGVLPADFYLVKFISDLSKSSHIHASLLFTKEEVDRAHSTRN